jgi:hypothetical protein
VTEYRVTFGQKYARETHPMLPDAHPDNWVVVEAPSPATARQAVVDALGQFWCDIYDPETWGKVGHMFPGREVDRYRWVPEVTPGD